MAGGQRSGAFPHGLSHRLETPVQLLFVQRTIVGYARRLGPNLIGGQRAGFHIHHAVEQHLAGHVIRVQFTAQVNGAARLLQPAQLEQTHRQVIQNGIAA